MTIDFEHLEFELDNCNSKHKSKKCHKPQKINCCKEENVLDCCDSRYQRLDKVRNGWANIAAIGSKFLQATGTPGSFTTGAGTITGITTRAAETVSIPIASIFENSSASSDNYGITIADLVLETAYDYNSDYNIDITLDNAYWAYVFVNTIRYGYSEACGKVDQISGWLVDTSDGNLQIFQGLPELNLNITDNRGYLSSLNSLTITKIQKNKLDALDLLYDLSIKAITEVNGNPKEEGNIVKITEKCGKKIIVSINRASSSTSISVNNTQFVIVASSII